MYGILKVESPKNISISINYAIFRQQRNFRYIYITGPDFSYDDKRVVRRRFQYKLINMIRDHVASSNKSYSAITLYTPECYHYDELYHNDTPPLEDEFERNFRHLEKSDYIVIYLSAFFSTNINFNISWLYFLASKKKDLKLIIYTDHDIVYDYISKKLSDEENQNVFITADIKSIIDIIF